MKQHIPIFPSVSIFTYTDFHPYTAAHLVTDRHNFEHQLTQSTLLNTKCNIQLNVHFLTCMVLLVCKSLFFLTQRASLTSLLYSALQSLLNQLQKPTTGSKKYLVPRLTVLSLIVWLTVALVYAYSCYISGHIQATLPYSAMV